MRPAELDAELAAQLATIPELTLAELRQRWAALVAKPLPRVRRTLLALALAWELQAQVHGGLAPLVQRRLAQLAGDRTRKPPKAGTRLVRQWKGHLHTVTIDAEQQIHWNGQQWNSLSEVARAITGTRWSGPAFFGLKRRPASQTAQQPAKPRTAAA